MISCSIHLLLIVLLHPVFNGPRHSLVGLCQPENTDHSAAGVVLWDGAPTLLGALCTSSGVLTLHACTCTANRVCPMQTEPLRSSVKVLEAVEQCRGMVGLLWGLTHWENEWKISLGPGFWQSSCLQAASPCLGQGEVSSFSGCVPRTLNPVLDHPFCL